MRASNECGKFSGVFFDLKPLTKCLKHRSIVYFNLINYLSCILIERRYSPVTLVTFSRRRNHCSTAGRNIDDVLFFGKSGPTMKSIKCLVPWVPWAFSTVVKWPELEADHHFPPRAKVKNEGSYTFPSSHDVMACKEILLFLHHC
jgi:hypothetical protein